MSAVATGTTLVAGVDPPFLPQKTRTIPMTFIFLRQGITPVMGYRAELMLVRGIVEEALPLGPHQLLVISPVTALHKGMLR